MPTRADIRRRALVIPLVALLAQAGVHSASRAPVRAKHGMVGSVSEIASRVGVEILKKGGNAVDAAVAVGFALAVTYPSAGNIGGGGLMVIRFADGRQTTIDYREVAPAAAHRDMFLDAQGNPVPGRSTVGHLAAGVPGSVAGMAYASKKYGRLPLATLIAPAIDLAEQGFEISYALERSLSSEADAFRRFPSTAAIFLKDGKPYQEGERLIQKDLARTLRLILERGPDGFYKGQVAELIEREMKRSNGLITAADLAAYTPMERPPVTSTYRGFGIVSMPPISSGGIGLIQLLNILEGFPMAESGHNSSRTMHLMTEAMKRTYADRSEWLGDPQFFKVPIAGLISKRYAETLRSGIDPNHATPSRSIKPGQPGAFESTQTTHYSVVDADGNAVATTTTLNGGYGCKVVVAGAGVLLNNEMDDFSVKPGVPNIYGLIGGEANSVQPGKRMLSSMTPTIITKDGKTFLVLGSPGGSRIITTVLQVAMNVMDYQMDVQEAVDAPRFHHQWVPDRLRLERRGFPADVIEALKRLGHTVELGADMGDVHAIMIDPKTGTRLGASDPRADGKTVGY